MSSDDTKWCTTTRGQFNCLKSAPNRGAPRKYRLSVAIPASVLENVQSADLQAIFCGQIARALSLFGVDEIVIFEDSSELVQYGHIGELNPQSRRNKSVGIVEDDSSDEGEDIFAKEKLNSDSSSDDTVDDGQNEVQKAMKKAVKELQNDKTHNSKTKKTTSNDPKTILSTDVIKTWQEYPTFKSLDQLIRPHLNPPLNSSKCLQKFVKNLLYLDCPPFARKECFKWDKDLGSCGLMSPLETPFHAPYTEWLPYREGLVIAKPEDKEFPPGCAGPKVKKYPKLLHGGSWIKCGLGPVPVWAPEKMKIGSRVIIAFDDYSEKQYKDWYRTGGGRRYQRGGKPLGGKFKHLESSEGLVEPVIIGRIVPYSMPFKEVGLFPGYMVRSASSLRDALHPGGMPAFELVIGTSDKGTTIDELVSRLPWVNIRTTDPLLSDVPDRKEWCPIGWENDGKAPVSPVIFNQGCAQCHEVKQSTTGMTKEAIWNAVQFGALKDKKGKAHARSSLFGTAESICLVIGGVQGLEQILSDPISNLSGINEIEGDLFDLYLNLLPYQRSRTMRTEEALFQCLSALSGHLEYHNHLLTHKNYLNNEEYQRQIQSLLDSGQTVVFKPEAQSHKPLRFDPSVLMASQTKTLSATRSTKTAKSYKDKEGYVADFVNKKEKWQRRHLKDSSVKDKRSTHIPEPKKPERNTYQGGNRSGDGNRDQKGKMRNNTRDKNTRDRN